MASKPFVRYDSSKALTEDMQLPLIRDQHVAKILFLATEPEQISSLSRFDATTSIDIQKLMEKFKKALAEKSVMPIRRALEIRLFILKNYSISHHPFSVLEKNFSDVEDLLNEEEEDILEFNEIFQMLSIPVPEFLKNKFDEIVDTKKIPVRKFQDEGSEFKTFFVYTENKILSEICDLLTPKDVFRIYTCLQVDIKEHTDLSGALAINVDEDSLYEVPGLKDAAFYLLIMNMIDQHLLNRLHTHILEYILQVVMRQCGSEPGNDLSRFEIALKKLKRYPVSSHPPGICLVFCMEKDRDGAANDIQKVRELFERKYRYDVLVKINPSSKDVQNIATKLQAPRNKFYDSLIVWFMGHGTLNCLRMMDKDIHRRREFIQPFSDIEWLNKKPKLFFIQACSTDQNESTQLTTRQRSAAMEANTDSVVLGLCAGTTWIGTYGDYLDTSSVNNYADTLIAYATKWYEPAARQGEGSLYVQTVVDQLKEYGHLESIENVLRKVHYNTNAVLLQTPDSRPWKQTPFYECSLQKEFVFHTPE